jgi:hypothetical protein
MCTEAYLRTIAGRFSLRSRPAKIYPYGQGHLHDTYLIETDGGGYILQRINHDIFKDIPGMMGNILRVTEHLRGKLAGMPGHDPSREAMQLISTREGKTWHEDDSGNFWRVYLFIPDAVVYQKIGDPNLAAEAGRLTGFFQALLSDPRFPLAETLPRFHDIHFRLEQYREAVKKGDAGRLLSAGREMAFTESRIRVMTDYFEQLRRKALVRVTHNDTKVNNILFDKAGRALCLIDLDTVMPGYVHFDFGDALRTLACTSDEDEPDLSKVHFSTTLYQAYREGYLSTAGGFLTPEEKELLPFAPAYLTYIIGLRFLTDHLNGDVYFKVHRPGHNLDRARVQFKLVQEIERIPDSKF